MGTGNVAAAGAASGLMWRATPGCMSAHVRLARLRGGLDMDAAASCEKASGEGPELCEKALPPDPLLEGRGQLQEAMGLMAGLDKEIEAAQSKLEELGDEESESCALETLEEQVEEQVPLEAGERMLKAMAPTAKGSTGKAQSATSVLRRVHSLEAQKTQLEGAIDKQMEQLKQMGAPAAEVGNFWETHVPVVDDEGFPRTDIPIEEILKGRAHLAELRVKYKQTMDKLQESLGDYFTMFDDDESLAADQVQLTASQGAPPLSLPHTPELSVEMGDEEAKGEEGGQRETEANQIG